MQHMASDSVKHSLVHLYCKDRQLNHRTNPVLSLQRIGDLHHCTVDDWSMKGIHKLKLEEGVQWLERKWGESI